MDASSGSDVGSKNVDSLSIDGGSTLTDGVTEVSHCR